MPTCDPIGTVSTPFDATGDAPRQGFVGDAEGTIHLDPAYESGLAGVEEGDEVDVVWFAHEADRSVIVLDDERGVFGTRSPARPNPVCVTTCEVTRVDGTEVGIHGVDMLDGSPVLDLKRSID